MSALGDLIGLDDRTVLVLGQELDVEHGQPDVGNALVHRAGDTLVLVDTGVTGPFRAALREAAERVGPWSRALLLTTHGHPDHIGNNDLVDELGVPAEHYVPARELDQIHDPVGYWTRAFERIAPFTELGAPPAQAARTLLSLFEPVRPFGASARTYEELAPERVTVGSLRFSGWSFVDGAVRVLRSEGHCAGHVVVHLRDRGVLHLSDEGNGPCGAMADADQLKIQTVLGAAARLCAEGAVTTLTDGHTFAARRGAEAVAHLNGLLAQAVALQRAAVELTRGADRVEPGVFAAAYGRAVVGLGVTGANPNPVFLAMTTVNQLRGLGFRPDPAAPGGPWSRAGAGRPPGGRTG